MNYNKITQYLFVGTTPKFNDYARLHKLEVSLVINMRIGLPPVRDPLSPPLVSLWLPTVDSPLFPIPINALQKGVVAALRVIDQGGVVYTHCSHGRHRGPAMGTCILIALGSDPENAMRLVEQLRPVADLHTWYIHRQVVKFAQTWNGRK